MKSTVQFCYQLIVFSGLMLTGGLATGQTLIVGAGAVTTTTSNGAANDGGPIYCSGATSSFVYSKHHMVYTASELSSIPTGAQITKIAWNKANTAAYSAATAVIFDIYLKNSTATGVPTPVPQVLATILTGATKVYGSTTQTFPNTIGWVEFTLPTPFVYTGGALELTTYWDVSAGGTSSSGATANFAWARDPGSNVLAYEAAAQSPNFDKLRTSRSQIRFTYTTTPLSIDLASIKATNYVHSNRIDWMTANENDATYFEIERSNDGEKFETLNKLDAKGKASDYTYHDEQPLDGANYYRLKMFEKNGNHAYSTTVKASAKGDNTVRIEAFPNPVINVLGIKINNAANDATVTVVDVTGRVVRTAELNNTQATVSMSSLANGIYYIKYVDGQQQQIVQVTKQ